MPVEDTFLAIKTVIYDHPVRRYWRSFVYGVTKSDITIASGRATKRLRFERESIRYVWDKEKGVRRREIGEKKFPDKTRKYLSRQQSTTLIEPSFFTPVPFMSINGGAWVTGVIMHVPKKNAVRILANDCGTVNRFYRSESESLLQKEYEKKLDQKDIFRSVDDYLKYLSGCSYCLTSFPQDTLSVQKYPLPTYIFTQDAIFYSDGRTIAKIKVDIDRLTLLKKALKITSDDIDKPSKTLSEGQLQSIVSIIGHNHLKGSSPKFSQYNEVMARLAWEEAPEASSQNSVAFFIDNLPSRLIAQLRAKDLTRRLKRQQGEFEGRAKQDEGISVNVPIHSYINILQGYNLRLTMDAEEKPKQKEVLVFVKKEPDNTHNVFLKILHGGAEAHTSSLSLRSEGTISRKVLEIVSPILSKPVGGSGKELTKLAAKISSYLRKNNVVKYILNSDKDAYLDDERKKDIEEGLKSSDLRLRGLAVFLKLDEINFDYAEFKRWHGPPSDSESNDFTSYLKENIEELLWIAGDLAYETSELFFRNFVIGALYDIAQSYSELRKKASKRKQKQLDEQERKLFDLAVACVPPEKFEELIVKKFSEQTKNYALYDAHLYGILIKSEEELLKPDSAASKLFYKVIDDEKIPFDCKRWLNEDKLRFLPAFDMVLKILDRSKKGKKDLLRDCSEITLSRIVGSLMQSIMNGSVPKVSLLEKLLSKLFFFLEGQGVFEIISCAVKAKNWEAVENILNATIAKRLLINVNEEHCAVIVTSLLENGQIYLLEKLLVNLQFYDPEYEQDINSEIIQRAFFLTGCDRYLVSSPPDYQFIQTLCRPAYILTPDAMFYFDGKESIKVNITLKKLGKLKEELEITDRDMDKGAKVLSYKQLKEITTKSDHTHLQDTSVLSRILLFIGPKQLCTTSVKNYRIDGLLELAGYAKPKEVAEQRNVTEEEIKKIITPQITALVKLPKEIKEKIIISATSPLTNISNSIAYIFKQIFRGTKNVRDLASDKVLVTFLEQIAMESDVFPTVLINIRPNLSTPTLLVCAVQQRRLRANSETFKKFIELAKRSNSLDALQAVPNRFLSFFGIHSYRYKTLLDLAIETRQFEKALALIRAGASRMSKANANIIMPYAMFESSATNEQLSTILNSTDYKLVLLDTKTVLMHNQIGILKNGEGNLEYQVISPKGELKLGTIKTAKLTPQLKQAIESSPDKSSLILIKNLRPYLNEILEIISKKGHTQKPGININAKFKRKTALRYAVEQKSFEKVNIILSHDILNIDLKMRKSETTPEIAELLQQAKRIQELLQGEGRISEQKAQFEEIVRYIRETGITKLVKQLGANDLIGESVPNGLFMQGLVAICCSFSFDMVYQRHVPKMNYAEINAGLNVASCMPYPKYQNKSEQSQQLSSEDDLSSATPPLSPHQ